MKEISTPSRPITQKRGKGRPMRWLILVGIGRLFLALAGAAWMMSARMNAAPADLDLSRRLTYDTANLDEGAMWPVVSALKELTAAEGAKIGALVKKAVS